MDLEIDREDIHRLDVKSRHVVVWRTETHFDIGNQAFSKCEIGTRVRRKLEAIVESINTVEGVEY